jgi:hypothetical protein
VTLFGADPPATPPPTERLSPGRRRTQRQHDAVARGIHPLALVVGAAIRVHQDADRTCGNCRFRRLLTYRGNVYPKCLFGNPQANLDSGRISHGTATDVRRWWPACTDHEPAGDR